MIGFIRSPFAKFVLKLLVVASIASLMLYGLNILLSYRVGVSRQLTLLKDLQNSDPYGKAHSSLVYNKVVDGGLVDLSDDTEDVENVKITKWIDMYVVDEHHEVLPYWFKHARKQKRRDEWEPYTLVHVDAHSDFGPLSYKENMTLFHWPTSKAQVHRLMQRNDVFITAAAATGIVQTFIWVWPSWTLNEDYMRTYGNHTHGRAHIGTFQYKGSERSLTGMCLCMRSVITDGQPAQPFTDPLGRQCLFATQRLEPYEQRNVLCNVSRQIDFHYVSEKYMHTSAQQVFGDNRNILLDVDEDYFGCEKAGDVLTRAGIVWSDVEYFDGQLRKIFCPKNIFHEHQLRGVLQSLLFGSCVPYAEGCSIPTGISKSVIESTRCGHTPQAAIRDLVTFFKHNFTASQQSAFNDLGFCLETTPNTARISVDGEKNSIQVCHGLNLPDSKNSPFYTPSEQEVKKAATKLASILRHAHDVTLVTLARSNRDGYVPRKIQPFIEQELIEAVRDMLQHKNTGMKVNYDSNLMY